MPEKCDAINGPCACGSWHRAGDRTFGQPGWYASGKPNGGDPKPALDCKENREMSVEEAVNGPWVAF